MLRRLTRRATALAVAYVIAFQAAFASFALLPAIAAAKPGVHGTLCLNDPAPDTGDHSANCACAALCAGAVAAFDPPPRLAGSVALFALVQIAPRDETPLPVLPHRGRLEARAPPPAV
jgi:hypothetical protein